MKLYNLSKRILGCYENRSRAKHETAKWISVIRGYLEAAGVTQVHNTDGETRSLTFVSWNVDQRCPVDQRLQEDWTKGNYPIRKFLDEVCMVRLDMHVKHNNKSRRENFNESVCTELNKKDNIS